MIDPTLVIRCAPSVAPTTIQAIVRVESRGDPLALHINGDGIGAIRVTNLDAAVTLTQQAIAAGYTVDVGLMGLNTRTLQRFRISIRDAFDPCMNLHAGAAVLTSNYIAAAQRFGFGEMALEAALSAYNTGDFWRGRRNGYLARYFVTSNKTLRGPMHKGIYSVSAVTHTSEVTR
jgi:type IV secretion system protein VirB1